MVDVALGSLGPRSIAATAFVLVERGCARRPQLVVRMPAVVRLAFVEDYAAVRIAFERDVVVVGDDHDDDEAAPVALEIRATLPDLVALLAIPLVAGMPKPTSAPGRAALRSIVDGRVEIDGRLTDARRLLSLLTVVG